MLEEADDLPAGLAVLRPEAVSHELVSQVKLWAIDVQETESSPSDEPVLVVFDRPDQAVGEDPERRVGQLVQDHVAEPLFG